MEYLKPTFTIQRPASTDGIMCEACVYPEASRRRGIGHAKGCEMRAPKPRSFAMFGMSSAERYEYVRRLQEEHETEVLRRRAERPTEKSNG